MEHVKRVKVESLAEVVDGQVVATAGPERCGCCGRACVRRIVVMSDGSRLGEDCAEVVDLVTGAATVDGVLAFDAARFSASLGLMANRRQGAYLTAKAAQAAR